MSKSVVLRTVLMDVGINTGESQKLGALELRFLGIGSLADPEIHVPP